MISTAQVTQQDHVIAVTHCGSGSAVSLSKMDRFEYVTHSVTKAKFAPGMSPMLLEALSGQPGLRAQKRFPVPMWPLWQVPGHRD